MAALYLNLPDELKARLAARAAESGYGTPEGYAEAILRADLDPPLADAQLEQLLLERLEDTGPGIEMTPEFKDQFREQVRRRRESGPSIP